MSGGNVRRSLDQEIDHVRECIERCMQMYMNKRETMNLLATQGNIQPPVTKIVWERLERDNPEFFRAYYARLAVQVQIMEFNRLLTTQAELMIRQRELVSNANGFNAYASHTIQPIAVQRRMLPEPENMRQVYALNNTGPSVQACMQGAFDRPIQTRVIKFSPSMLLSENPNVVLAQTVNEQIVRGEAGDGGSELNFRGPSSFVEPNPVMGDAYISHFGSNNAQVLDDVFLNYGSLEQHHQQSSTPPEHPIDSSSSSGVSLSGNAQFVDDFHLRSGVWEQQFQPISTPMDSSSSSGLSLCSNAQFLDDFHLRSSIWEQFQPISTPMDSSSSSGNVELLDPGSCGSLRNPYFG